MMDVLTIGDSGIALTFWPATRAPAFETEITVANLQRNAAGTAADFAMAAAGLGLTTTLVTQLGDDANGRWAAAEFLAQGVDLRHTTFSGRHPTPVSSILVYKDGRRSIVTYQDKVQSFSARVARSHRGWLQALKPRAAHFGGYFLAPRLECRVAVEFLRHSRKLGIMTSFDLGWDPDGWPKKNRNALLRIARQADLLFMNRDELLMLTDRRAVPAALKALPPDASRLNVIKLGRDGCLVHGQHVRLKSPGFKIKAVDTTGAGDAFCAGFVCSVLGGLSPDKAARFANAAGALMATVNGLDFRIVTRARVEKMMKSRRF